MRIIAGVEPNTITITVMHDDGHASSLTTGLSYLVERLTHEQFRRFFWWSWSSGKSVRDEFIDRVISATTGDSDERNWTLTMRFPGVPGPGWMLPDGSTHT